MSEKTKAQLLAEELFYKKKSAFETMSEEDKAAAYKYADEYSEYLYNSKTEREAVAASIEILKKAGYVEYTLGDALEVGGKYYLNNREKALFAFRVGTDNIDNGVRICAAHIDSPRLDLKPNPLYEDNGFGYLKTHYYGGIRKYQWPTIPLALHGVLHHSVYRPQDGFRRYCACQESRLRGSVVRHRGYREFGYKARYFVLPRSAYGSG